MKKVTYSKTTGQQFKKLLKKYELGDSSCSFEIASYLAANWKWDQHTKIVKLYIEGFNLGISESAYGLGLYYDADGNPYKSQKESLKWLRRAANAGHPDACNNLAFLIEHDFKKPKEAFKWYLLGAQRGSALAQFNVGISYEKGLGVKKSIKNALKYFKLAMLNNYSEARYKYRKLNK